MIEDQNLKSLMFVALLALPLTLSAETITGRVVNKTVGHSVPDVTVTLIQHGSEDVDVLRDTTDALGEFQFSIPAGSSEVPILLSTHYAGVDHHNHEAKAGSGPIELAVYETTNVDTAIAITSHHFRIDARQGSITQILVVENRGNRTFKTGEGHGHGLQIKTVGNPPEIIQGPENMHAHGGTIIDARPIQPGSNQVVFAIRIPPDGKFVQEVGYPTGSADLLVLPPDTTVVAKGLQDLGNVTFGDKVFRRFSETDLRPEDRIDFQILSSVSTAEIAATSNQLPWILGSLAVIFAFIAIYFRPRQKIPAESVQLDRGSEARKSLLLNQIADLDTRFESGDLPETDYNSRRNALKAEVADLIRSIDRDLMLHQIADLDDRFENGELKEKDYQERRTALKAQILDLSKPSDSPGN